MSESNTRNVDALVAAELARVGVAIVYKGELLPIERTYPMPPCEQYPRGAYCVCGEGGDTLIDAGEVKVSRRPKSEPSLWCTQ